MRAKQKINLFNTELLISQRSIKDIIDAQSFFRDHSEPEDNLFINSFVVHCGLKINLEEIGKAEDLPWYRLFKKIALRNKRARMEKLISVNNIMKNLGVNEVLDLVEKISALDYGKSNGEVKKKEMKMRI